MKTRFKPLSYEERLEKARELMKGEQVSPRRKFFGGRWWIMVYRFKNGSPTGVSLGVQIYDDENGRELCLEYGYNVRPANCMFG